MRKLLRDLRRQFPDATVETTHGNHYRLSWPDGRVVIVSNTPGTQGFMRNAIADARRQSRKGGSNHA